MIRFLQSLHSYGQRLIASNGDDVRYEKQEVYYRCDIENPLNLTLIEDDPILVTQKIQKSGEITSDALFSTINIMLGVKETVGARKDEYSLDSWHTTPSSIIFYDKTRKALKAAGEEEILEAFEAFWKDTTSTFGLRDVKGKKGKQTVEVFRKSDPKSSVLIDVEKTAVLFYQGKPLVSRPKVKTWWENRTEDSVIFDLVTGKPCKEVRLHRRIRELDTPLISFESKSYTFSHGDVIQDRGANFPVSAQTVDVYNYAMSHICREKSNQLCYVQKRSDGSVLEVGWWLEKEGDDTIYGILNTLFLGEKEPVAQAWRDLRDLKTEGVLNFGVWTFAKSRFALLSQWSTPIMELRENLLRFYDEHYIKYPKYNEKTKTVVYSDRHVTILGILAEKVNKTPLLPGSIYPQVIQAILQGTAYPKILGQAILNARSCPSKENWFQAYSKRSTQMLDIKPVVPTQITRDNAPNLVEFLEAKLGPNGDIPVGDLEERQAYLYGFQLALYSGVETLSHYRSKSKYDTTTLYKKGSNPQTFYLTKFPDLEARRGRIVKDGWKEAIRLSDCIVYVNSLMPARTWGRKRPNNQYFTQGWMHGQVFLGYLKEYTKVLKDADNSDKAST